MASLYRAPTAPAPSPAELHLTVVSAKHLKNVNWKTGDLKPYCVFWVDPTCRLSTKSDESGSTRPVWNERFNLPLPDHPSHLTLEVFHSMPSETPKPLVGTLRIPLKDLPDPEDSIRVRTFELARPSGRPQGKIRIKIGICQRVFPPPPRPPHPHQHYHDYHFVPPQSYYYNSDNSVTPPPSRPPPPHEYNRYAAVRPPPSSLSPPPYGTYPYYPGYFSSVASPAPLPPRPFSCGGVPAPSAPVDVYPPYDQRQRELRGKAGFGTGLAVGAVAGALGGMALEEGLTYEEEKVAGRVENDFSGSARDDYSDYRADF